MPALSEKFSRYSSYIYLLLSIKSKKEGRSLYESGPLGFNTN